MSEILHGVLNMPPELWCNDEVSILQRHSCYLEANRLIEELKERLAAAEGRLEEYEEKVCNCRWEGETLIRQCELHEAHVDAIHEWAERAKVAEQRLAAAEAKIPDKPLGVFSEGAWVFATTAQTFTAEDLDIAAFVKYRDYMKGGE